MRFIGTKIITAEPMARAAYIAFRGWQLPADEDGGDDGYLVEYEPDGKPNVPGRAGYVTWTPKRAFDAAYRPCDAMTFGLALEALKRGARVARAGWNGKGMWIALSGSTTEPRNIAWENFWSKQASAFARDENGGGAEVLPCILMKTADNRILMGWLASQSDMLAEDWLIVDSISGALPGPFAAFAPHQQRVLEEKRDLEEKITKLEAFFHSSVFAKLEQDEQQRLHDQAVAMHEYFHILADRIDAFAPASESRAA